MSARSIDSTNSQGLSEFPKATVKHNFIPNKTASVTANKLVQRDDTRNTEIKALPKEERNITPSKIRNL